MEEYKLNFVWMQHTRENVWKIFGENNPTEFLLH
jgi:hypothetical protein